jgi:Beta-glucosidase (SUN family)
VWDRCSVRTHFTHGRHNELTRISFYINPPGVTTDQACIWGSNTSPVGNWAPYVAGANTDASGNTYVKLGWNPVYLEAATPFRNTMPTWGVEITCSGGNCNGLPCKIDPSQNSVNEMVGSSSNGAGGGAFCVVTVPKGATATFEVFEGSSGSSSSSWQGHSSSSASAAPSTSSSSSTAPTSSSSAWSSSSSSAWSAPAAFYATSANWTSSSTATSLSSLSSDTSYPQPSVIVPLFNENTTSSWAASSATLPKQAESSTSASGPAVATATKQGNAATTATTLKDVAVQVAAIVVAAFLLL